MKDDLILKEQLPTAEEFIAIRDLVGWGKADLKAATISLKRGLYTVCLRKKESLVGLGRVVGDGGLYFYLQDIIVHPDLQGRGHGSAIMALCMRYVKQYARHGSMVGLFAAKGKEGFYENWGFIKRPTETLGNGMCIFFKSS